MQCDTQLDHVNHEQPIDFYGLNDSICQAQDALSSEQINDMAAKAAVHEIVQRKNASDIVDGITYIKGLANVFAIRNIIGVSYGLESYITSDALKILKDSFSEFIKNTPQGHGISEESLERVQTYVVGLYDSAILKEIVADDEGNAVPQLIQ